jgi:phosphatidate cytidylyltransferase
LSSQQAKTGGRSLSKSVIVGVLLGAVFLLSVLILKELFIVLAAIAGGAGAWELAAALRIKGWHVPRVPVTVGSVLIMPITYYGGAQMQWLGVLAIVVALILWRIIELLLDSRHHPGQSLRLTLRDFAASAFVVIYLPLMTSFTMLLMRREDGPMWVMAFVVTVSMIDTMGYLIGRKFGHHKLAPGVSPKKTWEGLLASITAGLASAILFSTLGLHLSWWLGLLFGALLLVGAVFGDLAESLIKRDLGVKDMSTVLPGHGGVMDRLDSILPTAALAYIFASIVLPI